MSEPTDTERARALAARDGLTTDGFNGPVCIACGQDTPNHDEDCPLMAVLAAVRAEGERAGLIRLQVYVATAIQNCEREKPGKTTDAAQAHYGGRLAAYRNVMRWLAEASECEAGKEDGRG